MSEILKTKNGLALPFELDSEDDAVLSIVVNNSSMDIDQALWALRAISFDQQADTVRSAWYKTFVGEEAPIEMLDAWVSDVRDTDAIVQMPDGSLMAYPYTNKKGVVKFSKPVAVVRDYAVVKAASGKPTLAIKALREEDGGIVVGGYAAVWGNGDKRDLQGDWFTKSTNFWLDEYPRVPAMFHHGLDKEIGLTPVGHRVKAQMLDAGLWVEDWINTSNKYWAMVEPLLNADRLFYSPGSAPHLIEPLPSGNQPIGEIKSFPVIEDTLTPIPAQFRLRSIDAIKSGYEIAELELPNGLQDGRASTGVLGLKAKQLRAIAMQTINKISEAN